MAIDIVDFPIKNGDFPIKNGDYQRVILTRPSIQGSNESNQVNFCIRIPHSFFCVQALRDERNPWTSPEREM